MTAWNIEIKGIMGTLKIIPVTEKVKTRLKLFRAFKGTVPENLELKGAIKTLNLALGLGMIGTAVKNFNPQTHEITLNPGRTVVTGENDGVVGKNALGKTKATEGIPKTGPGRKNTLIRKRPQTQKIAAGVIKQNKRNAKGTPLASNHALMIHLPKRVRGLTGKPLGRNRLDNLRVNQSRAAENPIDRAFRWRSNAGQLQALPQLTGSPVRVEKTICYQFFYNRRFRRAPESKGTTAMVIKT
jgi:hypothetical protein